MEMRSSLSFEGYHIPVTFTVNTTTDRDEIPTQIRRVGISCYVINEDKIYRLKGGTDNLSWEEEVTEIDIQDNTIYVRGDSTATTEDGTILAPFKTIQGAIDSVTSSVGTNIKIESGEYTENIIIQDKHNLAIEGPGMIGQHLVKISGTMKIGSDSDSIGLRNLEFDGDASFESEMGYIYCDNCQFNSFATGSTAHGYILLDYCIFNADIQIYSDVYLRVRNSDLGSTGIFFQRGLSTVEFDNVVNVALNHLRGVYISLNGTQYRAFGADYGINSTADGNESVLALISGTMLRYDGTYSTINKIGNCPYVIANFVHEPKQDTLLGTRVDGGLHADDIYAHFTPEGYTTISDIVLDHLKGIDAQIKILNDSSGETYILPPATTTELGGIKVGNNLTVETDGTLNAQDIVPYVLPAATTSVLGGIIVGDNLSITAGGVLSAEGGIAEIPPATTSTIGGIIVGNNLVVNSTGNLSVPIASDTTLGVVKAGTNITIDIDGTINAEGSSGSEYILPPASATTLGGVTVASSTTSGLSVNVNGALVLANAIPGARTFSGSVRSSVAVTNSTATGYFRNIYVGTTEPSSAQGLNGDLWVVYD